MLEHQQAKLVIANMPSHLRDSRQRGHSHFNPEKEPGFLISELNTPFILILF